MNRHIHTNIYGSKAYSIIAATSQGHALFTFSGNSSVRYESWDADSPFLFPVYGVDNEVKFVDCYNDVKNTKEFIIDHVKRLHLKLSMHYREKDTIYALHRNLVPFHERNSAVLDYMKTKLDEENFSNGTRTSWLSSYPCIKLKLMPLKLSDFENVVRRLENPNEVDKEMNQFVIEERKMLLKMLIENCGIFMKESFEMFNWAMQSRPTKEGLKKISRLMQFGALSG